jgi:hypothetical protein
MTVTLTTHEIILLMIVLGPANRLGAATYDAIARRIRYNRARRAYDRARHGRSQWIP